jgi:hypothetical protein
MLTANIVIPDDGSSKHLWNVSLFLRDYTSQYIPYSPPWEPEFAWYVSRTGEEQHNIMVAGNS